MSQTKRRDTLTAYAIRPRQSRAGDTPGGEWSQSKDVARFCGSVFFRGEISWPAEPVRRNQSSAAWSGFSPV